MVQAEALFLYQCAIKTHENGYDYFSVNEFQKEIKVARTIQSKASTGQFNSNTQLQTTQPTVVTHSSGPRSVVVAPSPSFARTEGTYISPEVTLTEVIKESPRITGLIKMIKGEKPEESTEIYEAKKLITYLGETINKKKNPKK